MKLMQFTAMFVACLVIALPIYTSQALAANELIVEKASGENDINGFLKDYDKVMIDVHAKIDGDSEISASQVKVNNFNFDSCVSSLGGFVCSYASPYYTIAPGTYPLTIDMFSDSGVKLKTAETSVSVDNIAPTITFDRNPVQSMYNVSVAFTVKDRAWKEDDFSTCSGIKRIEFWDGADKLYEIDGINGCSYTGNVVLGAPASERITIKAYDNMDQMSVKTSSKVGIDTSSPLIEDYTFVLRVDGIEVYDYIGGGNHKADVSVLIKEESLSASKALLDLSELGGSSEIPASSCTKIYSHFLCRWSSQISPSADKTINIRIKAEDDFGNYGETTISRDFKIDSTAPVITSIVTSKFYDGKSYIGTKNENITVTFVEAGAGVSSSSASLDISGLNRNQGIRNADECYNDGGAWKCMWRDITTTRTGETVATVYVVNTGDAAGNPAEGIKSASIYVDTILPRFVGDVLLRTISTDARYGNYTVSGDDIEVELSASDNSPVRIYGDFSRVYNGARSDRIEGDCTGGDVVKCKFNVGPIASGYRDTTITFTAEDAAGNTVKLDHPIIVYDRSDEEEPDYWGVASVDAMPTALDRQTTPLIEQRVYFHVKLESAAGAIPLEVELLDCQGGTGYINSKKIVNNVGSADPYIMIELKKTTANVNKIDLECGLQIISIYNNAISNPEIEVVPLEIKFYNMPLGEASAEVQDKIDDYYDTYIDGWWRFVGGLNTLVKYSQTICNLIYTVKQVVQFFGLVKDAWAGAEKVVPGVAGIRAGFCFIMEKQKKASNTLFTFGDKFCAFVNCKASRPEGAAPGLEKWSFDSITEKFGGAGGLDLNNWLGSDMVAQWTGKTPVGKWEGSKEYSRYQGYMNARDSMVLSMLTMCVPGIIYNLHKYREIQCGYINCLEESVQTGVPADACDKVKDYQTCKYVIGEIFQAIPFTAFYNYFVRMIKNAFSDPFSVVGVALAGYCQYLCTLPTNEPHSLCIWTKVIAELGDIIGNVKNIFDSDTWDVKNTYCHEVKDRHDNNQESGVANETKSGFLGIF